MQPTSLALGEAVVLSRSLDGTPDPIALFSLLTNGARDCVLLESADQSKDGGAAERSLLITRAALRLTAITGEVTVTALTPNGRSVMERIDQRLREANATIVASDEGLRATMPPSGACDEHERLRKPSVLDTVRAAVLDLKVHGDPPLMPLVAGSFAYDLLGTFERLPPPAADDLGWPDFELWLAEEVVVIEHARRKVTVLRYVFGGDNAEVAYNDASRAIAVRVDEIRSGPSLTFANASPCATTVDVEDAPFEVLVRKMKDHIVAGDVFQIVPSRTFSAPCPDALATYARLRKLNPSPYMFLIRGAHGTLFGASPERALTVQPDPEGHRVAISPLAGTRQRGRLSDGRVDVDLDARIEAELRLDHKEVAEHMMLVDLARNDIARVSRAGTRRVDRLLDVVRYSHVMHLESLVSGMLKDDLDALHAYVATMNMGTLVGAPKLRAAELLRQNERDRRGPYGGAVGYFTSEGVLDTCIVIRSAVVADGVAHVRAGCGVVFDSDPAAEALETRRKAAAVLKALNATEALP